MDFEETISLIKKHETFQLVSHILPDGDSVGSLIALQRVLRNAGKEVRAYSHDPVPNQYRFLETPEDTIRDLYYLSSADVLMVLDCSDFSRVGIKNASSLNFHSIINIDHHITNNLFGDVNLVNERASATGEILFQFFEQGDFIVDRKTAEALYVAISTDTGSFKYESTTPTTHRVTGALLEYEIDHAGISQRVFEDYSLAHLILLKQALSTLELYHQKRTALITISEEMRHQCGASMDDLEGIVNYAKNIHSAEIGILMYLNSKQEIKVGLRAKRVDVSKLAEEFNGGGHPRAAGFRLKGSYPEVKENIVNAVGKYI